MTEHLDRWPELLRDIALELGEPAALRLAEALGGQRVYIPEAGLKGSHDNQIDKKTLQLLRTYYAGATVVIPNFKARIADERRRYVLARPDVEVNELAATLGITYRRVQQIREQSRIDPRQLSLFD
ncbi:MAG: hypothetical protein AAF415_12995 [Pseudomonadota bacterium]